MYVGEFHMLSLITVTIAQGHDCFNPPGRQQDIDPVDNVIAFSSFCSWESYAQ